MVIAAVGFAIMNACAKEVSRRLPFLEVAFARSVVGLLFVLAVARLRHVPLRVANHRVLTLRVLAGTASMIQTFYALSVIPLAEASALLNLTPLFVAALGVVWLREPVRGLVLACLLLGMTGALLVFRPHDASLGLGGLVAVGASFTAALAMVSLRKLGASEAPETVVAAFLATGTLVLGVLMLPVARLPSPSDALLMVVAGVSSTTAQLAMTRAYALDVAARVGGMNYLNIVASVALASLLFGERPDALASLGIVAIILAGAGFLWSSRAASAG